MGRDIGVMGGECFELVLCGDERQLGERRDLFGKPFGKTDLCVQTRADGCTALGKWKQIGQPFFDAAQSKINLCNIAGELLTKCQRGRVLCMGATNFDDVLEAFCLVVSALRK